MDGFNDLKRLVQPKQFCDAINVVFVSMLYFYVCKMCVVDQLICFIHTLNQTQQKLKMILFFGINILIGSR